MSVELDWILEYIEQYELIIVPILLYQKLLFTHLDQVDLQVFWCYLDFEGLNHLFDLAKNIFLISLFQLELIFEDFDSL